MHEKFHIRKSVLFIGKAAGRNTQMVSCQQGSLPVVYPPRLDFQCTGLCQSSGFIDTGSYGSCIGYMSVCRNGDVFPRGDGFIVSRWLARRSVFPLL